MIFTATIPGPPIGKGRPRAAVVGGRVRAFTPKKTAQWEARASVVLRDAWGDRAPLDEPVEAWIVARFPRPQRMVWKRKPMPEVPHVSSPDADNVVKAVLDAIEKAGVVRNDRSIWSVMIRKIYCDGTSSPSVTVRLRKTADR